MARQRLPDDNAPENLEFIDELEGLTLPLDEGFHDLDANPTDFSENDKMASRLAGFDGNAETPPNIADFNGNDDQDHDLTDIDAIDDIGAFLHDSSPNDDYIPADPKPMVETWEDGRRVDPRRTMFRIIAILASIAAFSFVLILSIDLLTGSKTQPAGTALERELAEGRQIVLEAGPIGAIAPFLHPERSIPGTDIDLLDNGIRVPTTAYRLEFEWQTPQITILLDFSKTLTAQQKSRLQDLLEEISRLAAKKLDNEPVSQISVWAWVQGRPVSLQKFQGIHEIDLPTFASKTGTWSSRPSMLLTAVSALTNTLGKNHIILHCSDYNATASKDFSSERLYTMLKRYPSTAIAGLKLVDEGQRPDKFEDPVRYIRDNALDFVLPSWAFVSESVVSNTPATLTFLLARKAPIDRLRVVYKPLQSVIEESTKSPDNLRPLSLSLRTRIRDIELTKLTPQMYAPHEYRPLLDVRAPMPGILSMLSNQRLASVRQEWLFGVHPNRKGMQYSAGCLAARKRSVIIAATPGGIFLAKASETNASLDAKDLSDHQENGITFITPHLAFPEAISITPESGTNLASRFFVSSGFPRTRVTNPVLIASTGLETISHDALTDPHLISPARPSASTNLFQAERALSLLEALSLPCNLMFAKPWFYSASTFMTGSAQTNTVFVSGFEMLAVLDLLTREAALSNSIVLASSRALLPSAWEPSPSAQAHISSMLETTRSRGISIFVPGDTESASSIPPKTDSLIQIFPTDTIASIKAHYRPETFLPAPALTGFAPSRLPGEKFSGAAPAAAWAAGMACMARSIVPQASPAEISEILLRSSELRGEILPVRSFFNHGLLSPRLVSSVSSNRKFFSNLLLRFERMAENPYKDAESLFCDGFLKTLAPGTHILPIPETLIEKRFTKAYQYFDRNALYSGRPTTAPRYDANESFIPTNAERQELALVSWKGSLFLFCTRNGNRGWIINYGSLPAEGAAHGFDADDGLFFLATRHGEIIILDPASGLMIPVVMQTSSGNFLYAAIPTDHGNGQLSMSVDARHNALWITGSGSRFLTRLTWSRTGGLVYVRYDEDLDAHKIPLADVPFSPLTQLDHYISPAILHANGTFNILKSGKQPQYLRFDARGAVTPGAKQPRPETPPEP